MPSLRSWKFDVRKELDELDDRRAYCDDEERWKETEHQRENQLHRELGRLLLGPLPALDTRLLGMCAQRLRDTRPESIRLNEHRHQRADVIDLSALREVLEGLEARLAGAGFDVHHLEFM